MLIDLAAQSRINNNDIIVYKNGKWTTMQKGEFLGNVCQIMNEKEEKLKKEIELLTDEETETLLENLKGIFKNVTIANPERIPQALKNLGQAYDELGI